MSPVDTKDVLEAIFDEEFGFLMTNFSIKPVHVANGLARALTGRTYDTTAVTRLVRRYVRKQKLGVDVEHFPNAEVLEQYGEAFQGPRGHDPDALRLTRLRSLSFGVLAADGAVFPTQQSFTLSNERFVTRDPSDVGMGLFLSRLLTAEPKNRTEAATYLRELLQSEGDPWTTLALPVLEFGDVREETKSPETAERIGKSEHLFEASGGRLTSPTLRNLRDAYDRLARFERNAGSKLNSLRRLMLFGCFVLHFTRSHGGPSGKTMHQSLQSSSICSTELSSRLPTRAGPRCERQAMRSRASFDPGSTSTSCRGTAPRASRSTRH